MLSIKALDIKGTADNMTGTFVVPPYRGSSFMDPRGGWGVGSMAPAIPLINCRRQLSSLIQFSSLIQLDT